MDREKKTGRNPMGHRKDSLKSGKYARKPFDRSQRERRPLTVGATYRHREFGNGIVKELTDEKIVVLFGDEEKVFPRKKSLDMNGKRDRSMDVKKPSGSVFTFKGSREKLLATSVKPAKKEAKIGLHVEDKLLGPGVVSKITERGTYITYERTGEHVLYPYGLTAELWKSAFPEEQKKKEPFVRPKGKARVYKVPESPESVATRNKVHRDEVVTHTGRMQVIHHIEVSVGTKVFHGLYGSGVIKEITKGNFLVDFSGVEKIFPYPASISGGELIVSEE